MPHKWKLLLLLTKLTALQFRSARINRLFFPIALSQLLRVANECSAVCGITNGDITLLESAERSLALPKSNISIQNPQYWTLFPILTTDFAVINPISNIPMNVITNMA